MILTLIGYRGSGKSSVAAPLAEKLGWRWIDADAELERRQQRSIRSIFETDGEAGFRHLERQLMAELLASDRLVLAAGGGAVLDSATRRQMRSAGPVVWLQASVATLAERIGRDANTAERRPDLTSAGGQQEIAAILAEREPIYREAATIGVATDDRSVEQIVEEILEKLDAKNEKGTVTKRGFPTQ